MVLSGAVEIRSSFQGVQGRKRVRNRRLERSRFQRIHTFVFDESSRLLDHPPAAMATLALRDREPSRSRLLTGPRPLPSPTIWRFLWPRAASGLMSCGGGDCLQASGDERGHWDALKRTLQGVPATVAALEAGGVSASPPTATASTAPGLEPL